MKPKKKKHLPHGAFRVIHVSESAVREFVYETIIDKGSDFLDLLSVVNITVEIDWDEKTGDLLLAFHDDRDDITLDMDRAKKCIGYTTPSLLSPQRPYYCTVKESDDGQYELLQ